MDELTFRDYMKVLFRQKWIIILSVLVVNLTVMVGLKFRTPVYAASVKLLISAQKETATPYYRDIPDYQNVQPTMTQSEIVMSRPVIDRALKAILPFKPLSAFVGYERRFASPLKQEWIDYQVKKSNRSLDEHGITGDKRQEYLYEEAFNDLTHNIKVEPVRDTDIFTITVTDYDPVGAAVMANIISRSYIIFDLEQQLAEMQQRYGYKNIALLQLKDDINAMTQNLNGQPLDNVSAIGPASVKIIEQAYPPLSPKGPKKTIILILGFVLSCFLGLTLAYMFDYFDQTFRSPGDIERFLGISYLGSVPRHNKLTAFKNVSEQIYLLMKDKSLKSLLLTAYRRREGVTTITFNVGKYISSVLGHRVLVIDANPKKSRWRNKGAAEPGLFNVLEEKAVLETCLQKKDDKFHVLPSGQATLNPGILLGSHHMADILKQAKLDYEIVLIDAQCMSISKDALELSNAVGSVVFIVAEGRSRLHAVKSVLENFKMRKANILGAVLNLRRYPIPEFIYERV